MLFRFFIYILFVVNYSFASYFLDNFCEEHKNDFFSKTVEYKGSELKCSQYLNLRKKEIIVEQRKERELIRKRKEEEKIIQREQEKKRKLEEIRNQKRLAQEKLRLKKENELNKYKKLETTLEPNVVRDLYLNKLAKFIKQKNYDYFKAGILFDRLDYLIENKQIKITQSYYIYKAKYQIETKQYTKAKKTLEYYINNLKKSDKRYSQKYKKALSLYSKIL